MGKTEIRAEEWETYVKTMPEALQGAAREFPLNSHFHVIIKPKFGDTELIYDIPFYVSGYALNVETAEPGIAVSLDEPWDTKYRASQDAVIPLSDARKHGLCDGKVGTIQEFRKGVAAATGMTPRTKQ